MFKIFVASSVFAISPLLWLRMVPAVSGLNHGRPAKLGEFPYIMRVRVKEETTAASTDDAESGNVDTGVLVGPTQVLTTCDSVGFFTGSTVNKYNLSRVTIMGGSVHKTGLGGETQQPVNSVVHEFCYALMSSDVVLFNFGMYELSEEFTSPHIKPAHNPFKDKSEMTQFMKGLWNQYTTVECSTAGWGNPRKQFEGSGMPDHFERFAQVLQTTDMKVQTFDYCRQQKCAILDDCLTSMWEYGFMCAEAKKGGPCNDDDGAPLVCKGAVIAIYSNVERCEDIGIPRNFLRMDLVYEFVYGTSGARTIRAVDEDVNISFLVSPEIKIAPIKKILYAILTAKDDRFRNLSPVDTDPLITGLEPTCE